MHRSTDKYFTADTTSVRAARHFLAATLLAWDRTERLDDLVLCLSELACNAVDHTTVSPDGFTVRLHADSHSIRLEVHDTHHGQITVQHPTDEDTSGRGLLIVDELSDQWGVTNERPRGKIVWARFDSTAGHHIDTRPRTGPHNQPATEQHKHNAALHHSAECRVLPHGTTARSQPGKPGDQAFEDRPRGLPHSVPTAARSPRRRTAAGSLVAGGAGPKPVWL